MTSDSPQVIAAPPPTSRRRAFAAVLRVPSLRRLFTGLLAARLAEDAAWLVILLHAYREGGVAEVGLVAVVLLLPAVVLAPAVAAVTDWVDPRRSLPLGLAALSASLGAVGIMIVAGAPSWAVYLTGAVFSVGLTFPAPAASSVIPRLATTPDQLTAANVGVGMVTSVGELFGPAIAGLLLIVMPTGPALVTIAVLMASSALICAGTIPHEVRPLDHHDDPPLAAIGSRLLAGVRLLRSDREARLVVFVLGTTFIAAGALDVGAAAIAVERLGRPEESASVLIMAIGAGTFLGVVLSIGLVGRRRLSIAIVASAVISATAFAALSQVRSVIAAIALLVVVGAGASMTAVAGRTMLQSLAPDDTLARVFGVLESLSTAALAVGGGAFSAAVVVFGLESALVLLGAGGALVPALLWPALRSIDDERTPVDLELLALVRSTVVFAPLPPFALEQVLRNLVEETFDPGAVVLRRGDHGDDMMIVGKGHLEVLLSTGERINRGVGSYVGEVALLTSSPRNADVVAGPDGAVVQRLRREVFLDAVDRVPRSRARAEAEALRRSVPDEEIENPRDE